MNPLSTSDESPIVALRVGCGGKARVPRERHRDAAPVREIHGQSSCRQTHCRREGGPRLNRRSTHTSFSGGSTRVLGLVEGYEPVHRAKSRRLRARLRYAGKAIDGGSSPAISHHMECPETRPSPPPSRLTRGTGCGTIHQSGGTPAGCADDQARPAEQGESQSGRAAILGGMRSRRGVRVDPRPLGERLAPHLQTARNDGSCRPSRASRWQGETVPGPPNHSVDRPTRRGMTTWLTRNDAVRGLAALPTFRITVR